jgi:hypothetical protein
MNPRRWASLPILGAVVALAVPSRAASAARDAPTPVPEPATATQEPERQGLSGSLEFGKEWRSLYGIPLTGYDLRGTLGPSNVLHRHLLPAAFASVMVAHTDAGLGVNHVVIGGRVEARSRYFYAGISAGGGYFGLDRADSGSIGNAVGLLDLFLGPQVPFGEHFALALEGRLSLELLPGHDDTLAFGPGLAVRALVY